MSRSFSTPPGARPLLRAALLCAIGAALASLATTSLASGGKGFTYGWYGHDPVLGVDQVGIAGTGNPFTGDTKCTAKRPVLCVNVDGSSRPPYAVAPGQEFYQGWLEGHHATTAPVAGSALTSAANGDSRCVANFGAGWRMAEFHDPVYYPGMDATHFYYASPWSPSPWPPGGVGHGGHTPIAIKTAP